MSNDSPFMVKTERHLSVIVFSEVMAMDLVQTGRFIAGLRKEHGLTQEQFGEKMGVTNKTVSRWETGTYLPPAEALLMMSEMFDVSINENLSGRRLSEAEYKAAAEENLRKAVRASCFSMKDRMDFFKRKWLREHIAIMACWGAGILGVLIAGMILKRYMLISAAMMLLVLGHGWRNNAMMAYAESHVFDGAGCERLPL